MFRGYSIAKEAAAPGDNEDAFCLRPGTPQMSFAVSDGVARTILAGGWARRLVRAHRRLPSTVFACDGGSASTARIAAIEAWLDRQRRTWLRWSRLRLGERLSQWNVLTKHQEGAHATFLAVFLELRADGCDWQAVGLGDTCLFIIEAGMLTVALPLEDPGSFNNFPPTFPTRRQAVERWPTALRIACGSLSSGAYVFGMTDELAKWFLTAADAGDEPWNTLAAMESESDLSAWVRQMRETNRIEHDDMTLVFGRV